MRRKLAGLALIFIFALAGAGNAHAQHFPPFSPCLFLPYLSCEIPY